MIHSLDRPGAGTGRWLDERARRSYVSVTNAQLSDVQTADTLLWAAANAETTSQLKARVNALVALAGYDIDLIHKSIRWAAEKYSSTDPTLIMASYQLSNAIANGNLDLDLADLLRKAANPGVEVSDKRISDYSLMPVQAGRRRATGFIHETFAEVEPNTYYKSGLDAPSGFVLKWKGRPQATVAIGAAAPDEVMIYQMQGIIGKEYDSPLPQAKLVRTIKTRGLVPFHWHTILIGIAERVARHLPNIETLGIQGAAKNYWVNNILPGDTEPHLSLEMAERAYDGPAQRAGFALGADGNWHRPLA